MGVLRMIKLFAWEKQSSEKLFKLREDELYWIRRSKLLGLINYAIGVRRQLPLHLSLLLTIYGAERKLPVFATG